jgi:hypothetical protein
MTKNIIVITSALLKFRVKGEKWLSSSHPDTGHTRVTVEQDGHAVAMFPDVHAVYDEVSAELVVEEDD